MSILVTRPSPAGEELVSRLRTLGQVAWHFPLIEFSPGRQLPQLADQLAALGESDLLFGLSQHAVAFAQSQLHQQDRKWPRLPDYFAIGRTTASPSEQSKTLSPVCSLICRMSGTATSGR